ncbi:hypothetical protein [Amycolatopsis vastitatis]|uniref:Uncharacterized protein n=1 Tax=Amycolatopsis vastitatis TaxID=1905142 RepID=A0A229SP98_9PSEU|nr:hypothetical protein [Amycolatopsis vastitatis]OXM60491.1 hypothetical protein CF165_42475 [Amycolatopsis vastitatis]
MSIVLRPAQTRPGDEYPQHVQVVQRMLREELGLVRESALAWRNGLAALLAGLLGFSLIKGRSDISTLVTPWRITVGALLLLALLAGAASALVLLRAAHGHPRRIARTAVRSAVAQQRWEAEEARTDLNRGTVGVLTCAALLVVAVAVTWYGPAAAKPTLEIVVGGETICGSVVRTDAGRLTLKTDHGERTTDLTQATGFRPIDNCGR